jgi:hypothetical protein
VLAPLTAHNTIPSQLASEPVVPRMNRINGDLTIATVPNRWSPSVSQPDPARSLWPSRMTPSIHFRAALTWLAIFPLVAIESGLKTRVDDSIDSAWQTFPSTSAFR